MDDSAIDGQWRLVELDGPGGPVELGDILATLLADCSSGEMGFRVANSVLGTVVLDGRCLHFAPEVSTAALAVGVNALVESAVHEVLESRPRWDVTAGCLRLSDDEGHMLTCQRVEDGQ